MISKSIGLRIGKKLLLVIAIIPIIIAVLFLLQTQEISSNPLREASEGGELLLTAIGRNHESLMGFVNDKEELAQEILRAAREAQDHAKAKLNSAKRVGDDVVIRMVENYDVLYGSSSTMTQGVGNLLTISDNLDSAFSYYRQKKYNESVRESQICLQTLAPLVEQFDTWNRSLNEVEYYSIATSHRDRMKHATAQYRSEMKIYNEYVLLLECIAEGAEYSKQMDVVDQLFDQLQHALAGKEYENATRLLQEIYDRLQLLEGPDYQKAANAASQLDPGLLGNYAYDAAQDMIDRFYSIEGIQSFENYLESLKSFVKSSSSFDQGDMEAALGALAEGLSSLGEGKSLADPSIQPFYTALESAFDSLQMKIRGQPDLG